jgi:hypothetical protein
MFAVSTALSVTTALLLAACAGNGQGLDSNGQPLQPGSGGAGPLTADFDSIQAHVFTPICTVCHIGAGAPHGLRLDAADSYNLLVGIPSDEVPSLLRVKPGDPSSSYVIQKLEGHAAVGERMPLGGPYLAGDVIAVIRQWITDGAMRTSAAAATASFTVNSIAPSPDDVLHESPPQVMIGFNRELDVTRVDAGSARIERLTSHEADAPMEVVPARIAVPSVNRRALLLWPNRPLTPGRYRVVLRTSSVSAVTDIMGAPLDAAPHGTNPPAAAPDEWASLFDVEGAP